MDDKTILAVWNKGTPVSGYDPSKYRKDECGAWIKFSDYGKPRNKLNYVWEIDHITSKDHGGGDELSNLRPLQWENNVEKSNGRLVCKVKAYESRNSYLLKK